MNEFHRLAAEREAVEALQSILTRGVAISVSPKIPVIDLTTSSVTVNPVSTKSGAVHRA